VSYKVLQDKLIRKNEIINDRMAEKRGQRQINLCGQLDIFFKSHQRVLTKSPAKSSCLCSFSGDTRTAGDLQRPNLFLKRSYRFIAVGPSLRKQPPSREVAT